MYVHTVALSTHVHPEKWCRASCQVVCMQNAHQTEGLFSYCTVVLHLKVVLNSICHIFMDPVE